ncbi:hypothetical protein I4U23_009808 [Adineta vaga]|nr:hypothetical protein I4U23_009808 [Adineta vaga]
MIKFILLLICIKYGYSHPDGAPDSVCDTMMPHHNVAPKQCETKYIIQSDKSVYYPNDIIRLTVHGATNDDYFKGILLIAKNQHTQEILGTWSITNSAFQTIACDGIENTAVTHITPADKLQIEALWHSPAILSQGDTIIKATIVKSYEEIYVDCFNITLIPKQNNLPVVQPMDINSQRDLLTKPNTNISWTYTNNTVTVTMVSGQVNLGEWRAIGFSDDRAMGNEYVFICQVSSTGTPLLRRMHTKSGKRPAEVIVINAVYENGQATCEFSFDTTSGQIENETAPIVAGKDYYLNFAAGILRLEGTVAKHNFTFVSSRTYQLQNSETINLDQETTTTPSVITTTTSAVPVNDVKANISWTYTAGITTVNMRINNLKVSQWFSLGLSIDRNMGEDHVFICQRLADNTISLQRTVNPGGHGRPQLPGPSSDLGGIFNVTRERIDDGIIHCDFTLSNFANTTRQSRQITFSVLSPTTNYYPLIAIGNMNSSNWLLRHSFRQALPQTVMLNQAEAIQIDPSMITTPSTGSTTSTPQSSDVAVNITWTYIAGITTVNMRINNLKASQWLAIGLSGDRKMGEDHVFICRRLADETISLQRFINPGEYNRPELPDSTSDLGGIFSATRERLDDGVIHCDFTLSNFANTTRQSRQITFPALSQTTNYYPLIAIGNLDGSNLLIRHSFREALSQTVVLNRAETITVNAQPNTSNSVGLMKAHGIIMIFTWIVLVSTGILIARYFKKAWSDRKICGKAVWFAIHRTIMTSVAILTLIAFVLILVYKKGQWVSRDNRREFAHSIIGILVICFAIIQPFMALFRCNPDDRYRFIFNYAHATVGFSAFILSIAAIFLAMFFGYFDFRTNKEWAIVAAWSCWLPVIFVIFEMIEVYFEKTALKMTKTNTIAMHDRNGTDTTKIEPEENTIKDRIKAIFLLLHVIIAFGLALALMLLIGQSKI